MHHVLIIHKVADDAAWKKVFDRAAGIRQEAGECSYRVLRFEREPNKIVLSGRRPAPHEFSSSLLG